MSRPPIRTMMRTRGILIAGRPVRERMSRWDWIAWLVHCDRRVRELDERNCYRFVAGGRHQIREPIDDITTAANDGSWT